MGLLGGSHLCDREGEHPHDACDDCTCPMCFAFWHANIFRYEDELREAGRTR